MSNIVLCPAAVLKLLVTVAVSLALWMPAELQARERLERRERIALIAAEGLPAHARLALDDLNSYLQRSLDAVVRRYPAGARLQEIEESACILFGTRQENATLAAVAQAGRLSTDRLGAEGAW